MEYCAFLRGVNVKGTNMKMEEVCRVFENAGMQKVTSVLASGNIIFSSGDHIQELKSVLENAMSAYFNYQAFLFIRTKDEIEECLNNNPYTKNENLHIYGFIGDGDIKYILMKEFEIASKAEDEKAQIAGNVFYWQVPKGSTLDSSFGKVLGKKNLKDKFTSRNMNTFEKILKKMS